MSTHSPYLEPWFLSVKNHSFSDYDDNSGYLPGMTLGEKIRAQRELLGLSQVDLAKRVGVSQVAIDKIERGKTRKSRYLPEVLASLGMPLDLISETVGNAASLESTVRRVPAAATSQTRIIGKAKAGEFIAIEDLGDWDEQRFIEDAPDPRFPNARRLAFEVEGDSMNALKPIPIPEGAIVSALALEDVQDRMPLRDGMIVVVERTRHGGLEREWSIKQLEIYEDRVEFHPRSTNPRHKPIVVERDNEADDGTTVTIIAIVRRLVAEFF